MANRVTFPLNDSPVEIKPRPLFPAEEIPPLPESKPPQIVPPASPESHPDPAAAIAERTIMPYKYLRSLPPETDAEPPGQCKSDVLLEAIRITAAKPKSFTHDCALRDLVKRYAAQHSLDF